MTAAERQQLRLKVSAARKRAITRALERRRRLGGGPCSGCAIVDVAGDEYTAGCGACYDRRRWRLNPEKRRASWRRASARFAAAAERARDAA